MMNKPVIVTYVGPEAAPPAFAIEAAVTQSVYSPCQKSQRGAVAYLWLRSMGDGRAEVAGNGCIATGHNAPPLRWTTHRTMLAQQISLACDGSPACRASCSARCVHAEAAAVASISEAGYSNDILSLVELVHVKTVSGILVSGKGPSCIECSKVILDRGIRGIWLFESTRSDSGVDPVWRYYTAREFHEATCKNLGVYQGVRS